MIIPDFHIVVYFTICSLLHSSCIYHSTNLELGRGGLEVDTLDDGGLQIRDGLLQQLSLDLVNLADSVELGDTALAQLDVDAKVLQVLADLASDRLGGLGVGFQVDVGRRDDTSLAGERSSKDLAGEFGTSLGHGQGGGTGTSLGFDDFVTTELDSVDEGVSLLLVGQDGLGDGRLGLRQQGQDGVAGVTTNNGDDVFGSLGGLADDSRDKGRSPQAVQGGDTEQPAKWGLTFHHATFFSETHFLGSKMPCFLKTSAKMGTVELTGLEMTKTKALGADWAMAWARVVQIPALIYGLR
jgi:hypothetical protein